MYFESDVNPSPERIFAYRRTQCKVNSWRLDDGGDPIVVDVRLIIDQQARPRAQTRAERGSADETQMTCPTCWLLLT